MSTLDEEVMALADRHNLSGDAPEDVLKHIEARLHRAKKKEALFHQLASLQEQAATTGDTDQICTLLRRLEENAVSA